MKNFNTLLSVKKQRTNAKTHILIFLGFFVLLQGYGQSDTATHDYIPFPTANAIWRMEDPFYYDESSPHHKTGLNIYSQYLLTGDSITNDKTYHKLQRIGYEYQVYFGGHEIKNFDYYAGCYRNDTLEKKVWYLSYGNETEKLLYDFNWQIGDTLSMGFLNTLFSEVITNIDSLLLNDGLHKRFEVSINGHRHFHIIEGIGSTTELVLFGAGSSLMCFSVDGEAIYIHPNSYIGDCTPVVLAIEDSYKKKPEISIYPNPIYSSFRIKGIDDFPNATVLIYNTYGQIVMQEQLSNKDDIIHVENLSSGVYIVNVHLEDGIIVKCKLIKL